MRHLLVPVLALLVLAVAAPVAAGAQPTFSGKTGQGRPATIVAADDGRVTRIALAWRAECGDGAFVKQVSVVKPTTAIRTRMALRASYVDRPGRGVRLRVALRIRGTLRAERWSGTVQAAVVVRRKGATIDRCRLSQTTWSATRHAPPPAPPAAPSPSLPPSPSSPAPPGPSPTPTPVPVGWHVTMTSDPGDPIGQGGSYDYRPGAEWALAPAYDRPTTVELSLYHPWAGAPAGWFFNFAGPNGAALEAGRRYEGARRFSTNIPEPGMDVSSPGTACNQLTGWFEVQQLTRDPDGKLRSTTIVFEQWCQGGTGPLRGTVRYTA